MNGSLTPPLEIRSEVPSDDLAIDAVTRDAFAGLSYSSRTEHFIVRALRRSEALSVSLVAVSEGTVVGHVAASPVQISGLLLGWFGLGPVSVAPARQRQGVGSALVRAALSRLHTDGAAGCVLLGNPAYYTRFGFARCSKLYLPGVPPEDFMSVAWVSPTPSGEVSFHEAFDAVA
jgi:predicted N-acetyltransferase YhbS